VIVVSRGGDLPGVASVTLSRLTLSPEGRPGTLSQLNFDSRGAPVTGAALSPDGRMLALSLVHEFLPDQLYGNVEVINVASGATRTWTGQGAPGYWPGVPAWADDGTVVVPWWHGTGNGMGPAEITGVRQLNLAAPGASLAAARLVAFPVPVPGLQSALLAPGGGEVITSSCRAGHHAATVRVAELSATDGRLIRVLRTQTARFGSDADAADAVFSHARCCRWPTTVTTCWCRPSRSAGSTTALSPRCPARLRASCPSPRRGEGQDAETSGAGHLSRWRWRAAPRSRMALALAAGT